MGVLDVVRQKGDASRLTNARTLRLTEEEAFFVEAVSKRCHMSQNTFMRELIQFAMRDSNYLEGDFDYEQKT